MSKKNETYKVKVEVLETVIKVYDIVANSERDAYNKFIVHKNPETDLWDDYDIIDSETLGVAEVITEREQKEKIKEDGVYIGTITKPFLLEGV